MGCNGGKSTCSGGNKGAVCDKQITSIKITRFWLYLMHTILFFFSKKNIISYFKDGIDFKMTKN